MRYVYGGLAANLGRFGAVTQGQVLDLTDEEISYIQGNVLLARVPTAEDRVIIEKTGNYTMLSGDKGKLLRSKHTAGVTYKLPTAPAVGDAYEFQDASAAGAATNNITIDPQTKSIDAGIATATVVLNTDAVRYGVYWNGAKWVSF